MQNDDEGSRKQMEPGPTPGGHEEMNGEGMQNGVPEGATEGDSAGRPTDQRRQSETAPHRDQDGGGAGSGGPASKP